MSMMKHNAKNTFKDLRRSKKIYMNQINTPLHCKCNGFNPISLTYSFQVYIYIDFFRYIISSDEIIGVQVGAWPTYG